MSILALWMFIGLPLTVIGGIGGKRMGNFQAPIQPKNFPMQLPQTTWHKHIIFKMVIGGFLPFSSIYIELYYIFNTIWAYGTYQFWGILILVFIILILVTSSVSITFTYFQISAEDYRWWWHSFLIGSSTGIYIYLFSIYYYFFRASMSGFLQATFYFGYMAVICYYFGIMLGSVSFYSSLIFMKRIYKDLHTE